MSAEKILTFRNQPKPCSGDMRISWRLPLVLLFLYYSRGQKASFSKLHILNDAIKLESSQEKLLKILNGGMPSYLWKVRVEPAFSRALDFTVGEGFADWGVSNKRTILKLNEDGKKTTNKIIEQEGIFSIEKNFLKEAGKRITESAVDRIVLRRNV